MTEPTNIQRTAEYLLALERFATGSDLARFFDPDAVQEEYPNMLVPTGKRRSVPELLAAAERGREVLSEQRYELISATEVDGLVAIEVRWTGRLAIDIGAIPIGGTLSAYSAMFLRFTDGKIVSQHNYDCFDPV